MTSPADPTPVQWLYVIEHELTGERLGTNSRDTSPVKTASFGARLPLLFRSVQAARKALTRWAEGHNYLTRAVTVAGRPVTYFKGPDYGLLPPLRFVMLRVEDSLKIPVHPHELMREDPEADE